MMRIAHIEQTRKEPLTEMCSPLVYLVPHVRVIEGGAWENAPDGFDRGMAHVENGQAGSRGIRKGG